MKQLQWEEVIKRHNIVGGILNIAQDVNGSYAIHSITLDNGYVYIEVILTNQKDLAVRKLGFASNVPVFEVSSGVLQIVFLNGFRYWIFSTRNL